MARACLVGVGWWYRKARVAESGCAGALTVVWPAGLRAAYVSQPAAYVLMSASQLARRAVHWLRRLGFTRCAVWLYSRASGRTVP